MQHIVLSGVTAECSFNNYCIESCDLFKFITDVHHDTKKMLRHIGQQKLSHGLEGDIIKNDLSACQYTYLHLGCVTTKRTR